VDSANPSQLTALLCDGLACDGFIWKYLWDELAESLSVAHFHYRDRSGRKRKHDWRLDDQSGQSLTLPDSDLTVTFKKVAAIDLAGSDFGHRLDASTMQIAEFSVRQGDGPEVDHIAVASLPMIPNVIPKDEKEGKSSRPLVEINYDPPPTVDPKTNGLFGVVEVLGTPEGKLHYRVFGRGEEGQAIGVIRSVGPVTKGEEIMAFGGNPNQPMTISFNVEDYLTAGREKEICEPIVLPKGKMG